MLTTSVIGKKWRKDLIKKINNMKKILIIGSGIFGTNLALVLSKKFMVTIYEKKKGILNQASKINQFRFHKGYHYPRSQETVNEIKQSEKIFFKKYKKNKSFGETKNYYAIAKKNSKINFNQYIKFLKKNNLKYKINNNYFSDKIESSILSQEKNLNYFNFKKNVLKLLNKNKRIKINYNKVATKKDLKKYDFIFICAYSQNNNVLNQIGIKPLEKFKYELVEKTVVQLPAFYKNKSFIVMDGEFLNVDPYLGTKYHLLSSVKYSKIEIVKKIYPIFRSQRKRFLTDKIHKDKKNSNFEKIIKTGSQFMPFLKEAKYIGSYFIVRTLSNSKKNFFSRLTTLKKIRPNVYTLMGGKWNTSVFNSKKILNMLK